MSDIEADRRRVLLGSAGLVALLGAGLVLASSWFVPYPVVVRLAAWLIAFAGMGAVFVAALRQARATDTTFFAAIGRSFKALEQFIFAFF